MRITILIERREQKVMSRMSEGVLPLLQLQWTLSIFTISLYSKISFDNISLHNQPDREGTWLCFFLYFL